MLRNTQKIDVHGEELALLKAHGPLDLVRCIHELQEDTLTKYQKPKHLLSQFFKPGKAVDNSHNTQFILYTNGPEQEQQSLIMSDGKNHYFYDLIKGAAASFDVKEALGSQFVDVSGIESRANFVEANMDMVRAREMSMKNLPNLQVAITYAIDKMKAAEHQPKQMNTKTAGPGGASR
jgi:hypothetical protein